MLRPVRRAFNRLQARVEQPAALLYNPNVTASDIRLLVSIARKKGDHAAEVAALLRMVQRAVANETEQRAVRRLGTAAPAPAASRDEASAASSDEASAASSDEVPAARGDDPEIRLTLRRPGPTAPYEVTIGDQPTPSSYWRAAWADLPGALTDQLTTGVLTRLAATRGVTAVRAADPASVPVARAVAAGIGARYGEQL